MTRQEIALDSIVRRQPTQDTENSYRGLPHCVASKMGARLVAAAARTGCWVNLPEHLSALRRCLQPQ